MQLITITRLRLPHVWSPRDTKFNAKSEIPTECIQIYLYYYSVAFRSTCLNFQTYYMYIFMSWKSDDIWTDWQHISHSCRCMYIYRSDKRIVTRSAIGWKRCRENHKIQMGHQVVEWKCNVYKYKKCMKKCTTIFSEHFGAFYRCVNYILLRYFDF